MWWMIHNQPCSQSVNIDPSHGRPGESRTQVPVYLCCVRGWCVAASPDFDVWSSKDLAGMDSERMLDPVTDIVLYGRLVSTYHQISFLRHERINQSGDDGRFGINLLPVSLPHLTLPPHPHCEGSHTVLANCLSSW